MKRSWVPVLTLFLALGCGEAWGQRLSGFIQAEYVNGQDSVDQLNDATGAPLNQNRFLIRRTRLKLSEEWSFVELAVEAEFNTVAGPQVGLRQMEAAVVWPPHPMRPLPDFRFGTQRPLKAPPDGGVAIAKAAPVQSPPASSDAGPSPARAASGEAPDGGSSPGAEPVAEAGASPAGAEGSAGAPDGGQPAQVAQAEPAAAPSAAPEKPAAPEPPPFSVRLGGGIFRVPFGVDAYEVTPAERLFASTSQLAQAFFPGDFDVGARLSARWRGIGAVFAIMNGEPLGERSYPGADPNTHKDFFGRATVDAAPARWFRLQVGASGMYGTGFHPGTPATKDVLVWRDMNEDGIAQLTEIQAIRGSAATASENFERWGFGGDLRLKFGLPFGELTLFGEAAIANNLDRGLRPADPVALGRDQRSVSVYGGFTQEILGRLLLGFRADHYVAMLDEGRLEAGTLVRAVEPFTNFSFAAAYTFGSSLPFGKGRLMADYTIRLDPLGRDAAGRPADLANNLFTLRLQLEI